MDYQFLILLLATLACPIGMGAMMWWMHKSMNQPPVSKEESALLSLEESLSNNQALENRVAELERYLAAQQQTK